MPRVWIAAALLALAALPAPGQNGLAPKPAPEPSTRPFVPEGEKPFFDDLRNAIPGTRIWVQWLDNKKIWHYNTTQSVGDGAAMTVYVGPTQNAKQIGWLCSMDTGVQPVKDKEGKVTRFDLEDYKGISLWIKGDGSDATAVFSTHWDESKHKFRVPLKDTNWHKVFLAWDQWDVPITGPWSYLTFSVERKDHSKANGYIVDRIHFYKDEKIEEITPTPDVDPPGLIDARGFAAGRENIKNALAKLKARQPVKIVVAGDSIVWGAQMGYTKANYNYPETDRCNLTYWKVLAGRLKAAYGYGGVVSFLRTCDDKKKEWYDELPKPSTARANPPTQPAPDAATRPTGDLQVIAVAKGGWTAKLGLEHIAQVLNEKPDLVIWEYGTHEGIYNQTQPYAAATEEAVRRLKEAGIEVVLQTLPPSSDLLPHGWLKVRNTMEAMGEISVETRRIAKEKGCAVADMYSAFTCRGVLYTGDLYADSVHLNHRGHEICADVLDALLTGREVKTWSHGPAADKAKAKAQE